MKKIVLALSAGLIILSALTFETSAIPNPWIDCGDDISCGAKKSGFNFPLNVKNYSVRAMDGMMEITFSFKKKTLTARKVLLSDVESDKYGIKDISGDYNNYPVNKSGVLKNGAHYRIRGYRNKYKVVSFSAENGYYSFLGDNIKPGEVNDLYKLLEEAEAPIGNNDYTDGYTLEQLQDLNRIDGIVEPVYSQDYLPNALLKKGVTEDCFERANLGNVNLCTASQINMIKEYYKKH